MVESIFDLFLFIFLGVICWVLSKKIPSPSYKTLQVEFFDMWYIVVAIDLVVLIKSVVLPMFSAFILSSWSQLENLHQFIQNQNIILRSLLFILMADFGSYWVHRLLHHRIAWRFHSMHHGIKSLNWISGVRGSPLHFLFILSPIVLSQVIFLSEVGYWAILWFTVFDTANQHFCHSNIRLPFEKQIEYFLITPRMHFVHHNPFMRYTNSNYGLYFSIWDHIFKTYVNEVDVSAEAKGKVGLDYNESMSSGFFCLDKHIKSSSLEN